MADAVDLVRAYLHVNGYFTVTEYPLLEAVRGGSHRMVTDLDLLAFRFAGAGRGTGTPGAERGLVPALLEADPILGGREGESDMIVGEVKEGVAELNRAASEPRVLAMALTRFGCCGAAEATQVVTRLLRQGQALTGHGHRIRLVAFGSTVPAGGSGRFTTITLGHVVSFLRTHLRQHWALVRHAQVSDPALGFLGLLEKAERGAR